MTTTSEAMNALTGFDELAIEKHFGQDVYAMAEARPLMSVRATIFADLRHQGTPDKDAYQRAMEMSTGEVGDYFEDEPEDVLPDDPDSELGKGS